jgi:hypothetical protein
MHTAFDYTRRKGEKHTYHVQVTLMKRTETGTFEYSALVHRGTDYVGPTMQWKLQSGDENAAAAEAKILIERDIEDLVGIDE